MADGVSTFAGPGNSAVANGGTLPNPLPNGQPNCLGDILGHNHPGQYSDGNPGFGQNATSIISGVFSLGAAIGVIDPGTSCYDFVSQP